MFESDLALVTGASRGIGRAIALALGGAGATVVGTATSSAGAQQLSADFHAAGIKGGGLVWNAADPASTDALVAAMDGADGLPTILVNNAGIARDALILRMKSEDWEQTLQVNLSAVFRLSKA
ncbi:MAG TPA: SDR family NAD(P)-dependent oxidoreductase, partial [Steroidobacteraceae bacterium]